MDLSSLAAAGQALFSSSQWNRKQIEGFQSRRLQFLARHAFERVPYYRDLFQRHGVRPQDIQSLDDLARLPIAHRMAMQERPAEDLVACGYDPDRLIRHRTSGSTGTPFTIRRTWFEERLLNAFRNRELRRIGLRWTDLRTRLAVGEAPKRSRWRFVDPEFSLPRRLRLNCLDSSRTLLETLAEHNPDVLSGKAGILSWLATETTSEDLRRIRPRLVTTGGETLTPSMRRQISESFGVPVYDYYGAHEFNLLARECPQTGLYHIIESNLIVEILKDGRPVAPGESGELHGTALHSLSMPFIRYPVGDIVTRGPDGCACGAHCATLQSIQGRIADRFSMPDGSTIHPYHLVAPLVRLAPWVRRYQIIQETLHRLLVKVVAMPGHATVEEHCSQLHSHLEAAVPDGVAIIIELVAEIPPAPNGKFRPYYSLLKP